MRPLSAKMASRQTILILTTDPPERLGGMEHLLRMLRHCFESGNYQVELIHRENCNLPWKRRSRIKYIGYLQDLLIGYFVGRQAAVRLQENPRSVAAVVSNGYVGWYPLPSEPVQVHVYHGTSVGVAETSREHISTLGYLKMKYCDGMLFERLSGRHKIRLAVSNQVQDEVKRVFGFDTSLIWLPLNTEMFRPGDRDYWRTCWGIPLDRPVGIFVGNTMPYKGLHTIVRLVQKIPHVFWIVVIRGRVPSELENMPQVKLLADVPHGDLPGLYDCADFALTPYRLGPFSFAMAEALACGVPVIASPASSSPFFLLRDPLRRLLVSDQDDLTGFTAAVREVVSDPAFFRQAVMDLRPALEQLVGLCAWRERIFRLIGLTDLLSGNGHQQEQLL